jgi:hypothetical protein
MDARQVIGDIKQDTFIEPVVHLISGGPSAVRLRLEALQGQGLLNTSENATSLLHIKEIFAVIKGLQGIASIEQTTTTPSAKHEQGNFSNHACLTYEAHQKSSVTWLLKVAFNSEIQSSQKVAISRL